MFPQSAFDKKISAATIFSNSFPPREKSTVWMWISGQGKARQVKLGSVEGADPVSCFFQGES
uniref:Ubiquitin carboxyl-terminal hydrolase 16 isoform X1 n=1 Tax=Rhizophora mucronata TaxID=61149 RepID=A0A2P2R0Q5_RHIMU